MRIRANDADDFGGPDNRNHQCQLGGNPDCEVCGCVAAMRLPAVAKHRWGGIVPFGTLFTASLKIGRVISEGRPLRPDVELVRIQP